MVSDELKEIQMSDDNGHFIDAVVNHYNDLIVTRPDGQSHIVKHDFSTQLRDLEKSLWDEILKWLSDNLPVIDAILVGEEVSTTIQGETLIVHKGRYNRLSATMDTEYGFVDITVDIENRHYRIENNTLLKTLKRLSGKLLDN